jgi:hypothetical protein
MTSRVSDKSSDTLEGVKAAELIWRNDPRIPKINDPRTLTFAEAVIDTIARALARMPGAIGQVVSGAASAAEDLNIEPFQGLVEIIQNADDLGATEVRLAIRESHEGIQLLLVHNGRPVVCQNVLAMALPYLTTKRDDPNQKGRFGIGLNTLARISNCMSVHSKPYHFSVEALAISRIVPEDAADQLYDPASDTLIVLDLDSDFREDALRRWFDSWEEDGLLFLSSVRSFRWCDLAGQTLAQKSVSRTAWKSAAFDGRYGQPVRRRLVRTPSNTWTTFNTDILIPSELERSHKAKSESTAISIAVPENSAKCGIFVAFRTRLPTDLIISVDAQFDPSTAREELIDNAWNRWLVDRVADLIADVASGLLASRPKAAWRVIPLQSEKVGNAATEWPRAAFEVALERVRNDIGVRAAIHLDGKLVAIKDTAYEEPVLSGLLDVADIEKLAGPRKAIPLAMRDEAGRWRDVLAEIAVSQTVDTLDVLLAFNNSIFDKKTPQWWVAAADRLTTQHRQWLFGYRFWLTSDSRGVSCNPVGAGRPLVFGSTASAFAAKWNLLDRLHEVYDETAEGKRALGWLAEKAHFTTLPDAESELRAFADMFSDSPPAISDEDLREIRDRFDALPDRLAQDVGPRVGTALLLDGFVFNNGVKQETKVSPRRAYLPRSLDSEHPDWPEAAGTISSIAWLSASYEERLKI